MNLLIPVKFSEVFHQKIERATAEECSLHIRIYLAKGINFLLFFKKKCRFSFSSALGKKVLRKKLTNTQKC